ncbi:NAD-dependent epimerase/dehydratase family protein [Effusibacillus lacus]|uniref:UDP-glucose 4-epimerase n=1 Tax=Effusibacillus lacus TaxID=1348429 RepID=A0A292YCP9_9BACL|nr:NAD(P)-dependent oxidoreductase [Effusibacillus lacus]TCS70811.1 UDP-glucose 4-epimerase [Effusibacillus lacus]GAX89392.1 UDP-glucose 4-epimerase [Effusibacillus lacus]
MKVFVTGGAGFLGSRLVQKLAENNRVEQVKFLTRDRTKADMLMQTIPDPDKVQPVIGNLLDLDLALTDITAVIHCAAARNIASCEMNATYAAKVNVEGTRRLLELARRADVNRFVYVSSQSVYGKQDRMPLREDMPCNPSGVYALTKYIGEILTSSILQHHVNYLVLRLSRLYGTGLFMNEDNFITSKYPQACISGYALPVHGGGSSKFDFLHIHDAAVCIEGLLFADAGIWNETYNLASGGATSVIDIARMFSECAAELGFPGSGIQFEGEPAKEAIEIWHDISKIQHKTGWTPTVSLRAGIMDILKHCRRL